MDYGDIIYDQPQNESFCEKIESVQYKAALAITGAIHGTSYEKIYQELGLESLKSRRWYRLLSFMFKTMKKEAPNYLLNWTPNCEKKLLEQGTTIYQPKTDCSDVFRLFGRRVYRFVRPNSGAQKSLSFFSCISTNSTLNWRLMISQYI